MYHVAAMSADLRGAWITEINRYSRVHQENQVLSLLSLSPCLSLSPFLRCSAQVFEDLEKKIMEQELLARRAPRGLLANNAAAGVPAEKWR